MRAMSLILTGSPAGFSSTTDEPTKKKRSNFFCCTNDSTSKTDINFKRKDKLQKTPMEVN